MRIALLLLFVACRSHSAGTRLEYGSQEDIEKVLAAHGVKATLRACDNVRLGTSVIRSVACEADLTAAELATLQSSLGTKPAPMGGYEGTGSCAGFADGTPGMDVASVDSPSKQTLGTSKL